MEWKMDHRELIPLLGKTIYRPENVLVELCANSYDADASMVEISTKGGSEQILVQDDGCGMNAEDLEELTTLAKSRKRALIEKGETSPKYHRRFLGSFGIGIVSFFALGDFVRIFTVREGDKPLFLEIRKAFDDNGKIENISISDPVQNDDYRSHLLNPERGTTIEINNNKLNFKDDKEKYKEIRHKLSNLPLSDDFKMWLNDLEIKRDDFDTSSWVKKSFEFTLDNIDPTYKSKCSIYVNHQMTIEPFKRGIFLVVNGRVIEKDLYSALYRELTSPGAIAARVRGFIEADYLQQSIQANREDFFDTAIITEIMQKLRHPLEQIIEDYKMQKSTQEKEEMYTALLQRIEKAKNKTVAPNSYLKQLDLNFASNPDFEQEVVLIIAQLCQKGVLPFQILDYNGGSHIDCIVQWPVAQSKRYPNFIGELEIETTLDHFFDHQHDFRTKPDVICWELHSADFEKKKAKYMDDHPESIETIVLKEAMDGGHFGHQREMHFTLREAHNELKTFILRVYVVSQIVEGLCKK